MVLQESREMYLETIYILAQKSSYVRSIDVAEYMGFSKPSVSWGMGLLKQGCDLTSDEDGYLTLTELGRQTAEKIYERHERLLSMDGQYAQLWNAQQALEHYGEGEPV